jgi:signal transduction histidine kinase
MAENKNIAFSVQIPENTIITADSNILATVIRNLLTNAVKFTPSGGQVTLSVKLTADNTYSFTVSDTGTGMSEKRLQTLFRLDSAHSQRGTAGEQGSGLGLIVCRELLEKHGTTLHVESEEDKGSKFWFIISSP